MMKWIHKSLSTLKKASKCDPWLLLICFKTLQGIKLSYSAVLRRGLRDEMYYLLTKTRNFGAALYLGFTRIHKFWPTCLVQS
jgi:hypothetical protein